MDLKENLLRGIYSYGFEKPSPIQKIGIQPIIAGKDTIAQAQSGSGKTASFVIGLLQTISTDSLKCQGIILSPTRELALQINKVVQSIGQYMNIRSTACVGGRKISETISDLQKGQQVVVGTPGRIFDLIQRKILDIKYIKIMVVDEADLMLSQGFREQLKEIFHNLPGNIQVCLFSATMNEEIMEITQQFMREPATILVKKENLTLEGIAQYYIAIERQEWKYEVINDLYEQLDINQAIIYCNQKQTVEWLASKMTENYHTISQIHGSLEFNQRSTTMEQFRSGNTRVLISTDLLARGIDVTQVSLVINYDMPINFETYLHRIGRSGRYGKKGVAINFVTVQEANFLKALEKYYDTEIQELPSDLSEIQLL